MIELARLHSYPPLVLAEIVKVVEESPHMTSEKERFTFGLVVEQPGINLTPAHVKVEPFHVSKTSRLADLKNAVDSVNSCYVVDRAGMLRIVDVPKEWRKGIGSLTMMELSARNGTLTFFVDIELVRLFSKGEIARTWRKGIWLETPRLDFGELEKEGYPEPLLSKALDLCITMSETRKHATLVLQKGNSLESCQPFREINFDECELDTVPIRQLIGYGEMDGAVVVSTKGRILGIAQRLIYREIGVGAFGGARHESASHYSTEHECVVFVVSSDGPISIFKGGTLWKRLFAELKP